MKLETIALKAIERKKPTKTEAFNLIKDCITDGFNEEKAVLLYRYFLHEYSSTLKNTYQWLNRIKSSQGKLVNGNFRGYLISKHGFLWSTDGYIMAQQVTELEPGIYDNSGVKLDLDYSTPNFLRAIDCNWEYTKHKELMIFKEKIVYAFKSEIYNKVFYFDKDLFCKGLSGLQENVRIYIVENKIKVTDGERTFYLMALLNN